jgi:hypothetical protein
MSNRPVSKPFDPSTFIATFDGGVTISTFGEGQNIFSQGAQRTLSFTSRTER